MAREYLYYYEIILGLIGIKANDNAVSGIFLRPQAFIDLREFFLFGGAGNFMIKEN